jgi:hypothetical protein
MQQPMVVLLALVSIGCTVSAGTTPDAGSCSPSPQFFVSDVWPKYLAANFCGTAGSCHDFNDGHGYFRLRPPGAAPKMNVPLAQWPTSWRENYHAAVQLFDCAQPLDSLLLEIPGGRDDLHPVGPVVLDRTAAATVLQAWTTAP